jgi:hypothetical protein
VQLVILNNGLGGLVVSLVIQYADNILKGFAAGAAICVSTAFSVLVWGETVDQRFLAGAILVLYSSRMYSASGKRPLMGSASNRMHFFRRKRQNMIRVAVLAVLFLVCLHASCEQAVGLAATRPAATGLAYSGGPETSQTFSSPVGQVLQPLPVNLHVVPKGGEFRSTVRFEGKRPVQRQGDSQYQQTTQQLARPVQRQRMFASRNRVL